MGLEHIGEMIKTKREEKGYTQKELAELISVSEKTVSKWETRRGIPDITLFDAISKSLDISVAELFSGEETKNTNKSGNMLRTKFYVCPICGNIIHAIGEGAFYCCGNKLLIQEAEDSDAVKISDVDGRMYIEIENPMTKTDYISFIAYVTSWHIEFLKLYPEGPCEGLFTRKGHGNIYWYSNKNGLFKKRI